MHTEFFTDREIKLLIDICDQILLILNDGDIPKPMADKLLCFDTWEEMRNKFYDGLTKQEFLINNQEICLVGIALTIVGLVIFRYSDIDIEFMIRLNKKLADIGKNKNNANLN